VSQWRPSAVLILVGLIALTGPWVSGLSPVSVAWADDGDGDGDGDDGDDGDDGGGGSGAGRIGVGETSFRDYRRNLRSLFNLQVPRRTQRASPAPRAAPRPTEAEREIIARGLSDDDAAALVAQGYGILERVDLASLGLTMQRLLVPENTSLQEARAAVQALPTGEVADFNHYYRAGGDMASDAVGTESVAEPCEGLHCPARGLINWPDHIGPGGCGVPVTIGMIDTGINTDHAALAGAQVALLRVAPEDYSASDAIHGTAVAALLVGDPASRAPGLLPGLPLVAVDAFHKASGDERADAFTLVRGLDHLVEAGATVINLSLTGPANAVLEQTLAELESAEGIVVVAAAGNGGPNAPPAYPAAYDSVIAVTAVDRAGGPYRRAGRGPHVHLAAPGVEVWTAASVKGARWKTGTSFAAPYVTAAVALWQQTHPGSSPAEIRAALAQSAVDLGEAGTDDIFGHGLLNLENSCPNPARVGIIPVLAD